VLALARGMFGIRAECDDDAFDVGFSVPHQRTLVSQHAEANGVIAMCGRVHSPTNVR
jgi:hypothetical protein